MKGKREEAGRGVGVLCSPWLGNSTADLGTAAQHCAQGTELIGLGYGRKAEGCGGETCCSAQQLTATILWWGGGRKGQKWEGNGEKAGGRERKKGKKVGRKKREGGQEKRGKKREKNKKNKKKAKQIHRAKSQRTAERRLRRGKVGDGANSPRGNSTESRVLGKKAKKKYKKK